MGPLPRFLRPRRGAAVALFSLLAVGSASAQIRINEILPNPTGTDTGLNELVEIYNAGATTIDVTGWGIDDAVTIGAAGVRARMPEDFDASCGTSAIMAPGEYRLVHAQVTGSAYLNNTGDDVYLVSDRTATPTVIQLVTYPDASTHAGETWGCIPNGTTSFAWRTPTTLCASNGGGGDVTAPGTVSDLAAAAGTFPGEIRLTWTAPGDDGASGTASAYTMKVSHDAITSGTFGAAADVDRWVTEFAPHAGGTPETLWVAGLDPDSTWTFALETQDEVPNTSAVSNSPGTTPYPGARPNPDLGYTPYYGNLHSHTSYSDGVQTPADALAFARFSAPTPLDFLAVTEHNHSNAGLDSLGAYHLAMAQAAAANDDGNFVAICGQEWGIISTGGHANVFESPTLFGWEPGYYDVFVAEGDYTGLYTAYLANPPASDPPVVEWCHPSSGDFNGYAVTDDGKAAVHLMALISGPAFSTSTTESDVGSTTGNEVLFQDALRKGYRVSPVGDQDNHQATWGASTQTRTVVQAAGLTKSEILGALALGRNYGSQDHNTEVQFAADGLPMGSAWATPNGIRIVARVIDPDVGESVSQIDLLRGITGASNAVLVASSVGSSEFSWREHTVFTAGAEAHYYLRIRMSNNATIWTGPVYVTYDPSAVTAVDDRPNRGQIELVAGPNPTFGQVTANFSLPQAARNADLAIFDATGRRVRTLLNGPLAAGPQRVTWTGRDDVGRPAPSGVYFLRLGADQRVAVKKVLLIR
ncbi:MAG TPA: lamin tail domain-containing protein [Candidatus Eisenbacteria bacterium]